MTRLGTIHNEMSPARPSLTDVVGRGIVVGVMWAAIAGLGASPEFQDGFLLGACLFIGEGIANYRDHKRRAA